MPLSPNVIRYSGNSYVGVIKKNNYFLGINQNIEYGPTNQTNFWNGYLPPNCGYVIFINKESQGPSIYAPHDDDELMFYSTHIGGTNINTPQDALNYLNGRSDVVITNKTYPDIPTDGLLALFDSSFLPSYPKSGTTWYDLSVNGNHSTLQNSPTYLSTNDGSLYFNDNNSNYATLSDLGTISNFTINCWFYLYTIPQNGKYPALVTNTFVGGSVLNFSLGVNESPWNGKITGGFYNSGWYNTEGFTPTANTWTNATLTYDGVYIKLYLNGYLFSMVSATQSAISSGQGVRIARRWDDEDYIDGLIPVVAIYNRALTDSEVTSMYDEYQPFYNCINCSPSCVTPTPTQTPSPTPTPSITSTNTPTNTPTNTTSQTPTQTPTNTQTQTQTPTSSNTPTQTPTNTPTNTASQTPTQTQTPTNTPSQTATQTPTQTQTPTNTPSNTTTQTPTQTQTPTNTPTNTASQTPTQTQTPTNTPSNTTTQTPTQTQTPTNTPSNTTTQTPTSSNTPTQTQIPNTTPTTTSTNTTTPTPTPSFTPTNTPTNTQTPTTTPTPTKLLGGSINFVSSSNQYLTLAGSSDWAVGTGDFTIEGFIYQTNNGNENYILSLGSTDTLAVSIASGGVRLNTYLNGTRVSNPTISTSTNIWHHFAVSRAAGTLNVYFSGTRVDTLANTSNITDSTSILYIGVSNPGGGTGDNWPGNMTNIRFIKGVGLYTGTTLVVPTSPLLATAETKLLLASKTAGTFTLDSSNTPKTVTNNGTTFSALTPF